MKRLMLGLVLVALFVVPLSVRADSPPLGHGECTTIQEGVLVYAGGHHLAGQPVRVGFDIYGYNYQAHLFNGLYVNIYLGADGFPPYDGDAEAYLAANPTFDPTADPIQYWYWPYRDVEVVMKWNDAWLANTDCDGDGILDRHYSFVSYIGSGAWETDHMWGSDVVDDKTCHWDLFTKVIAAPADATKVGGVWYAADGTEIGPEIWGDFAIIQDVENDPCGGIHGIQWVSPDHAGFGGW
jgi:hypothetical protein